MPAAPAPDSPDPTDASTRPGLGSRAHALFRRSLCIRVLVAAVAVKVFVWPFAGEADPVGPMQVVDGAATVVAAAAAGYLAARALAGLRRRLLWRVRRRLILSYVFIGFVPVLLVVAFFLLAGILLFLNMSSYLVRSGLDDLVDDAVGLATTTTRALDRRAGSDPPAGVLEDALADAQARYPGASLAFLPVAPEGAQAGRLSVGAWRHLAPPERLPPWVPRDGFGGLLAYDVPDEGRTGIVVRAVAPVRGHLPAQVVVVDLPVEGPVVDRLREVTGVRLGTIDVVAVGGEGSTAEPVDAGIAPLEPATVPDAAWALDWVAFFDYTDWASGRVGQVSMAIQVSIQDIYERISGAQATLGTLSLGYLFLLVLGVIAGLFLVIECAALVMGFALARSITGSIHALFMGTERVRAGDFSHRIQIDTSDQLGELAGSFNSMTASVESLLRQAAEKKRLEEELRIARDIQMSLLPSGPLTRPGLSVAAVCVPAREVGGDYYDFFTLDANRVGILIADVSGKGTSAAFYMAELKGLVLSLTQIHQSPRQLLIEVNRIISEAIDSRSFITMTYAVLDLAAGTLTYARAGHTPLIYLPAGRSRRQAQVLVPDGLVLGLKFDGIAEKFSQLLEESTIPVGPGDTFVLYTDGVTEAMNAESDFFGESRLSQLVEEHCDLPFDELRERILREVEVFVGEADQHDDMTMILLRIDQLDAARTPPVRDAVTATS